MATVTHIIRSHYGPADREKLEFETGQLVEDQSDPWQTESSLSSRRRIRAPPAFVPAAISYDEWGIPLQDSDPSAVSEKPEQPSTSTAKWYRSLTAAASSREAGATAPPPRPSSAPGPSFRDSGSPQKPHREIITKNNWFISKALRSESSIKPSSPAPSLADLLARDPPPLPSEPRYTPPVWLHISPLNKGFAMLQRSGWKEGEGLGAHVARPTRNEHSTSSVKVEDIVANSLETREFIDLTEADFDASEDGPQDHDVIPGSVQTQTAEEPSTSHMQRSLLTPLPTVLKADRLGIGLKAKTEGPYKRSKKRVTHNAAALAAHIRSVEEMRRKKVEVGKGRRGFAKVHKREEDRRKAMLAYLNE